MPHLADEFLKRTDRAQSGRMASRILLQGLTKKNINTENFHDQLSFAILKIRREWLTGERDLFFLFIQKWISQDDRELLKFDSKLSYHYPYFDLSRNTKMKEFLKTKRINVRDLFDKDSPKLSEFFRYNREFDNLFFQ